MDHEKTTFGGFFLFSLAIGTGIIFAGIIGWVAVKLGVNFWQRKQVPGTQS
jgi:hypothetical protein